MSRSTYAGKIVLITGCYSGMGEAISRQLLEDGAEIHAVDIRRPAFPVASYNEVDLRDPQAIDAAFDRLPARFDTIFYCAGMPQTFPAPDVFKVNFSSMRYFLTKAMGRMPDGGSVGVISSNAGAGYQQRLPLLMELMGQESCAAADAWYAARATELGDPYVFSKEASVVWSMWAGAEAISRGIRVNCICPGPTSTPMMTDFESLGGAAAIDLYTAPIFRRASPQEQANVLLFLNSDDASYVNAVALNVDGGFFGGMVTGRIDLSKLNAQVASAASA